MPPPQLYPGLGPLPFDMGPPGMAGLGTRGEGLALLKEAFRPPNPQEAEYRRLRETYMGPMRRGVEESLGVPKPRSTVPERMNEARQATESAYYGAPVGEPGPTAKSQARVEPDLGPSASGRAMPVGTDRQMVDPLLNALGIGLVGSMLNVPVQALGTRYGPQTLSPMLQADEAKRPFDFMR